MSINMCIATNTFVKMKPNTNPPEFEGMSAVFYKEFVDVMGRFKGNLTYIASESYGECTELVRRGEADFAMVWEPYPMPDDRNVSQWLLLRSNKMALLSGFKDKVAVAVQPNFIVFDDPVITLFFLTTIAITSLFVGKIFLARKVASFAPWTRAEFLRKRLLFLIFNLCECTFLAQSLRLFMLKYKLGTLIVLWTSTNLVIWYETYLNTNQVQFNEPHLIESYAQMEEEKIKPRFISAMNDIHIMDGFSNRTAESVIKRLIKKYGKKEIVVEISHEKSNDAVDLLMKIIKEMPQQREVFVLNNEMLQLVKIMFCAYTTDVASDLKLFSQSDPNSVDVNAQVPFREDFLKTVPKAKELMAFVYQMYCVSRISYLVFKKLESLADWKYPTVAEKNQRERKCASNYFEVPDPAVEPLKSIMPVMLNYVLATAVIVLVIEVNFRDSLGLWLNNPKLKKRSNRIAGLVLMKRRLAPRIRY